MRRFVFRFTLLASFLITLIVLAPSSLAQSSNKSVTVNRRDGDITILANGDIRFVETWQVRFNGGPFTFAFRSIPLNRTTGIDGWGVSEGSQTWRENSSSSAGTYSLTDSGNE